MKDLWIIYSTRYVENENPATRMLDEALKHEIDAELRFYDDFEIKDDILYYQKNEENDFPKIVFLRCNHIEFAEFFEKHNIRVINSSYAIKYAKDKYLAHMEVKKLDIPQIRGELLNNLTFDDIKKKYGLPFIIKERYGLQGRNIYLIKSKFKFWFIKRNINKEDYLVQEFIADSYGKDLRLYFAGDTLIAPVMRKNDHSFKSNLRKGGKGYNIDIPKKIVDDALKIKNALKGEIISVDFVFNKDSFLFCEANTNAGFNAYMALGYDVRNYFMNYIKSILDEKK